MSVHSCWSILPCRHVFVTGRGCRQVCRTRGNFDNLMHSFGVLATAPCRWGDHSEIAGDRSRPRVIMQALLKGGLVMEEDIINGFAWFLAGLGFGALIGVLYAPKSGRETRDDLANNARQGKEYLPNRSKQVAQ